MAKVEILTGAERQRRWSTELKLSILQEAQSFGCGAPARRSSATDIRLAKEVLAAQIGISRDRIVRPGFAYRTVGEPQRRFQEERCPVEVQRR